MKYITTDKHPYLKGGIEFSEYSYGEAAYYQSSMHYLSNFTPEQEIEKGWIKEVEEKEFTRSDLLAFANCWSEDSLDEMKSMLEKWLKRRES